MHAGFGRGRPETCRLKPVRRRAPTLHLRASLAYDRGLGILAGAAQAQHAAASARTRRDQPLHGGIGQMVEGNLNPVRGYPE